MTKQIGLLLFSILLASCASTPLQKYIESSPSITPSSYVVGVPFISQTRFHCGPASLAMVMSWGGKPTLESTVAEKMYTPGKEGTFQTDFLGAARREGFLALSLNGHNKLFEEIANGNPVIVFLNLGYSWYPVWHYAVVTGYDLEAQNLTLHSGNSENLKMDLDDFSSAWEKGNHWAVVVLPSNRLSGTADEIDHLKGAVDLERAGQQAAAERVYQTILMRWPKSLGAWIGLGNLSFEARKFAMASHQLRKATQFHPHSSSAWHNLALAYASEKKLKLAKASARKALSLAKAEEQPDYKKNLQSLLNR